MIDYVTTVGSILLATLIPTYIGLYMFPSLKRIPIKYIAAVGIGLTFWYFFDTMGDASRLDVDMAIYPFDKFGGYLHVAVIAAFIAGIVALAIFDHFAVPASPSASSTASRGSRSSKALFFIPVAVAAVSGIHGLGEGWDFATTAAQASTQSLVDTFGNLAALASYPIHKFLEGVIIGSLYTIYVRSSSVPTSRDWNIPPLGILFGLPSVIGASIGYYVSVDTTYFFAFGVTSAIYAMLRLVQPLFPRFSMEDRAALYIGPKAFLAVGIGFFALYAAALLH